LSQQSRNKTKKTLSTTPLPSEKQKKVTKKWEIKKNAWFYKTENPSLYNHVDMHDIKTQ
jgi:hypothetical protein